MKTTPTIKTLRYSDMAYYLKAIRPNTDFTIDSMADGYEIDYWLSELATELKHHDIVKLSENFTCIGFDEVETFTLIRKSYLIEQLKLYIKKGASESFIENAILFGAADSILKRIDFEIGKVVPNIATQQEMTDYEEGKNSELSEIIKDIDNCGVMELYYDDFADFLDTITSKQHRVISVEGLDIFLDTIVSVFPKEVYYAKRGEQQAQVLVTEIEIFLNNLAQFLAIDRFSNKEKIVNFMVEDILECTTYNDYTSEDIKIAFSRVVSKLD